jgi:hypothetical protein
VESESEAARSLRVKSEGDEEKDMKDVTGIEEGAASIFGDGWANLKTRKVPKRRFKTILKKIIELDKIFVLEGE